METGRSPKVAGCQPKTDQEIPAECHFQNKNQGKYITGTEEAVSSDSVQQQVGFFTEEQNKSSENLVMMEVPVAVQIDDTQIRLQQIETPNKILHNIISHVPEREKIIRVRKKK